MKNIRESLQRSGSAPRVFVIESRIHVFDIVEPSFRGGPRQLGHVAAETAPFLCGRPRPRVNIGKAKAPTLSDTD